MRNNSNLIQQLQIFLDRYALMQSITASKWDPDKGAPSPAPSLPYLAGAHGRRVTITIDD